MLVLCDTEYNNLAQQMVDSKVYPGVKNTIQAQYVLNIIGGIIQFLGINLPSGPFPTFPCPSAGLRSESRPTDARMLLPGDFDLVCGMGDSMTAGLGADAITPATMLVEYRGTSYSIGSKSGVNTLPNSLRNLNPDLTGYAVGSGSAESDQARLNVAKSGAVAADLLPQVDLLEAKINSYGYEPDLWKHITIFIGGNDLCDSCNDLDKYSAANFEANIVAVLNKLKEKFHNVFVSLVSPPDVTIMKDANDKYLGGLLPLCSLIRQYVCPCATVNSTSDLQKAYLDVLHNIQNLPDYDTESFYVTVQPFLENIQLPRINGDVDMSYFAPDCFHWSRKSHSAAGLALWNNLMEARGAKRTDWDIDVLWKCPVAGQYLQ